MAVYQVLSLMIGFAMLTLKLVDERNRRNRKTTRPSKKEQPKRKRAQ
ncbi:putative holin-like toxin [Fictibacillus fluitans]|uniref:Holin-like toxin n=1 Tax=Fictibacillus fluitans TaxID=3058422 RepID=A0ABT8I3L3_9BACL|nr:putative holin-like toxin [Fictibacillus sp. NE201]MDN4527558.1 putative holin-like toxin [Fictibacillus sp. NE201]